MKTSQILKKAKSLIDSPEKWLIRQYARDADGKVTPAHSKKAVCFCSIGAISNVIEPSPIYIRDKQIDALMFLGEQTGLVAAHNRNDFARAIMKFNDSHTHAQVMGMFDRAIAKAEQKEVANDH